MPGHELARGLDAEVLEEDRPERLDLHLAEAGQRHEVGAELVRVGRVGPHAGGVAVVVVAHVHGELVDSLGHRARVAVDHRLLEEHRLEVGGRQRFGVDRAEALLQRERSLERLHHRDPLVELEAHQQGHRIRGDQGVRLVGLREVEAVGHAPDRTGVVLFTMWLTIHSRRCRIRSAAASSSGSPPAPRPWATPPPASASRSRPSPSTCRVLEDTGVITRAVEGRTHRLSLDPDVMSEAADWMDRQRALWGRLFDVVDEYLKEEGSK